MSQSALPLEQTLSEAMFKTRMVVRGMLANGKRPFPAKGTAVSTTKYYFTTANGPTLPMELSGGRTMQTLSLMARDGFVHLSIAKFSL